MAQNRSMHVSVLFFLLCLGFSWTTTARGGTMPMQLSREELVHIAGYGEEKLSSVLVMGSVLCQACQQPQLELHASHVSGSKVAVACKTDKGKRRTNWAYGTTDEFGEFMIDLPSQLHALPRLEEACVVRILDFPDNSLCHNILRTKPRRIKLSSVGNSIRVYTTGTVRINGRRRSKASRRCIKKRNGGVESSW
ncbi:uncharacterized protein M6B38_371305 [Iris pallida]|uniref:Pollen Ole e 1 allergen and extensin family protein n=1 Tax=Iris pallida TaxID=29817 RepID=A0AAX6GEL9_IRIPA|nr:uncharacterized protein M6B38_371305 [Iris pallida]